MIRIDTNKIYAELLKITQENNIKINEPMKNHTSFKIGGNADFLVTLNSVQEIQKVVLLTQKNKIPLFILGNGTNLLVKDKGIRGIVLKIMLDFIKIEEKSENVRVTVGAGVKLIPLAIKLEKQGIAGFEFASGIPGTIGGAVRMNAGAYGKEMKDIIISTKYMDYDGKIHEITKKEHQFHYRTSCFEGKIGIVLETSLELQKGNSEEIKRKIEEYKEKRKTSQPIGMPNAGSTFKRGEDYITAKLIDEAGLKGYRIGDAEVSTVHAGFIVNNGKAKAEDVLELIKYIKEQVYAKFQKEIQLEIEVVGE